MQAEEGEGSFVNAFKDSDSGESYTTLSGKEDHIISVDKFF